MANALLFLIRVLLGVILIASVFLICANAFGRYVLLQPIIWAEEVLGYSLVWLVYLGAVVVTFQRQHLRMDLVVRSFGPRMQAVFELIGSIIFLVIAGLIIFQAYFTIQEFTHRSQVADLPMDILHLVVPVSFGLMILGVVYLSFQDLLYGRQDDSVSAADNREDQA